MSSDRLLSNCISVLHLVKYLSTPEQTERLQLIGNEVKAKSSAVSQMTAKTQRRFDARKKAEQEYKKAEQEYKNAEQEYKKAEQEYKRAIDESDLLSTELHTGVVNFHYLAWTSLSEPLRTLLSEREGVATGTTKTKEPQASEPKAKAPEPKTPEPRAPEPRAPEPRAPEPRASEPRASEPRAPEPKALEPKAKAGTRAPEPKVRFRAPLDGYESSEAETEFEAGSKAMTDDEVLQAEVVAMQAAERAAGRTAKDFDRIHAAALAARREADKARREAEKAKLTPCAGVIRSGSRRGEQCPFRAQAGQTMCKHHLKTIDADTVSDSSDHHEESTLRLVDTDSETERQGKKAKKAKHDDDRPDFPTKVKPIKIFDDDN